MADEGDAPVCLATEPDTEKESRNMSHATMGRSIIRLEEKIGDAIKNAPHLIGHTVRCEASEASEGEIVLRGVVNSYYQKQMAQEAVRRIDGVERINNLVEVAGSKAQAVHADMA